jgi:hypothetical protein
VTVEIARLPRKTLKAQTKLYRIHRLDRGPWFFDDSPLGRFNPVGAPGRGACYWAEDPLGAWVESFRTAIILGTEDVECRRLSTITLTDKIVVRDLSARRALAAGVTGAITSGADYTASQQLAGALQGLSPGIRWRTRHDLGQKLIAVAVFGPAGPASRATLAGLPKADTRGIPAELVTRAGRAFGYEVLPTPR